MEKKLTAIHETLETRVWSLGQEGRLEEEMTTHSSILAWKIPWTEEPGGLESLGSQRVRHDWATKQILYEDLIIAFVVQLLSLVRFFSTPWTAAHQLSFTISRVCPTSCPLSEWCYLTISSAPSSLAFYLSQHQGFFQWADSSQQVAKVLELQLQHQSFQRIFRVDFL